MVHEDEKMYDYKASSKLLKDALVKRIEVFDAFERFLRAEQEKGMKPLTLNDLVDHVLGQLQHKITKDKIIIQKK